MTSISTLGQALDQIERLKVLQGNFGTLQTQIATGKKATLFEGLGGDAIASQRARADFKKIDTYLSNMDTANRRMSMMTNALNELKEQTGNIQNALNIQPQQGGDYDIHTIGDLATSVNDFIVNLINSKDGDRYLFSGAETLSEPLSDTGTADSYELAKLNAWVAGTLDTDSLIASYRDRAQLDDTTLGYSGQLSSGNAKPVTVRVDDGTELNYSVLGNNGPLRDILAATGMIKNLSASIDKVNSGSTAPGTRTAPGADTSEQNQNFFNLFNDLAKMLGTALDNLDLNRFSLSQTQAQMSQIQDSQEIQKNTLLSTIGTIEDVDLNEAAVKITSLQTQLEASYRVTALAGSLSLVNFLD